MKTSNYKVRQAIRQHILNVIDLEDQDFESNEERMKYAIDRFNSEYVFPANIKRYGRNKELFVHWLQGLPLNFEYTYYGIIKFLESIGLKQPENKSVNDSEELYYHLIYREFRVLTNKYNLKFTKL